MFDDKKTPFHLQRPILVENLDSQTKEVQDFCKVFGTEWRNTEREDTWMVGVDGCQFLCFWVERIVDQKNFEMVRTLRIEYYECKLLSDFSLDFINKTRLYGSDFGINVEDRKPLSEQKGPSTGNYLYHRTTSDRQYPVSKMITLMNRKKKANLEVTKVLREETVSNSKRISELLIKHLQCPQLVGIPKYQSTEVVRFCEIFGREWLKTNVPWKWVIGIDGHQFTCKWEGEGLLIWYHQYATIEDFIDAFLHDTVLFGLPLRYVKTVSKPYPVTEMIDLMKTENKVNDFELLFKKGE